MFNLSLVISNLIVLKKQFSPLFSFARSTLSKMDQDIVKYHTREQIAYITLNRPNSLNAIISKTPDLISRFVRMANNDPSIHVIIIQGSGRAFCAGYDLKKYAEEKGSNDGFQLMPWDPLLDFKFMNHCTQSFMTLWHSLKPVICKLRGLAIGGRVIFFFFLFLRVFRWK